MRYYDGQIIDICKFAFTGYAAIVGAALTLYKYGAEHAGADFRAPAVSLLAIGLLLGLCLLALMARDRVYFVVVTRYVNEHRQYFLTPKPLGFENKSRIYTDPTQPPFFGWLSSQALLLYILALMNSGLLAVAFYLLCSSVPWRWTILISASLLFLVAELVSTFLIYSPYERRIGDTSVTIEEWKEFASHRDHFESRGTGLRWPHRQESFVWSLTGISMV
jgi:hypothetical protein